MQTFRFVLGTVRKIINSTVGLKNMGTANILELRDDIFCQQL